jgi:hypothetical protein
MPKHTEGYWEDQHSGNHIVMGNKTLARVYHGEGRSFEESLANAKLMAAAPELLAACVSAREACRENIARADYKNEQVLHTAFLRCCEAIQKAIGDL